MVQVRRAQGVWYVVRIPYDKAKTQAFNVEMRDKVPFKVWVPSGKYWLVHQDYVALYLLEAARHGIVQHADAVAGIQLAEDDRATPTASADALFQRLGIYGAANVPLEFVEHCYAFWAQRYHGQLGAEGWLEELRQTYLTIRARYERPATLTVDATVGEGPVTLEEQR